MRYRFDRQRLAWGSAGGAYVQLKRKRSNRTNGQFGCVRMDSSAMEARVEGGCRRRRAGKFFPSFFAKHTNSVRVHSCSVANPSPPPALPPPPPPPRARHGRYTCVVTVVFFLLGALHTIIFHSPGFGPHAHAHTAQTGEKATLPPPTPTHRFLPRALLPAAGCQYANRTATQAGAQATLLFRALLLPGPSRYLTPLPPHRRRRRCT